MSESSHPDSAQAGDTSSTSCGAMRTHRSSAIACAALGEWLRRSSQGKRSASVMLAISTLDATLQALLYGAAVVLLVLGGIGLRLGNERVRLESLGLALFVFVFFWNALAAT
jgi:hypothetical protein